MNIVVAIRIFLITLLIASFWHGNLSYAATDVAGYESSVGNIPVLLDMSRYSSTKEVVDAFNGAYKSGDDVCPVLEYLEKNAQKVSSPFKLYDFTFMGWLEKKVHVWNPFVKDDGFAIEVNRPSDNKDVWRIHIEHTGCKLVEAKFRLQYNDKNFASRNIPFRFEYFEDTYLVGNVAADNALSSIVMNGQDSLSEISEIMKNAGVTELIHAEAGKKMRHLGGGVYGHSHKMWYYPPNRNVRKCAPWNIGIYVDDNGRVLRKNDYPRISVTPPYCHSL